MRFRNEIAPVIGRSTGATGNNNCLGGHTNHTDLATPQSRIRFLGQRLIEAYQAGDRETAIKHQTAMLATIRNQPPAVKAARLAEIDRAIAEADEFYFLVAGNCDRARLGGMQ